MVVEAVILVVVGVVGKGMIDVFVGGSVRPLVVASQFRASL